jgi:hypothetical protein
MQDWVEREMVANYLFRHLRRKVGTTYETSLQAPQRLGVD